MGFKILDRVDKKRIEEQKKVIADHLFRRRKYSENWLEFDEDKAQEDFSVKLQNVRRCYATVKDQEDSLEKLKVLVKEKNFCRSQNYNNFIPELILELL